jgi:hypothetical protein
MATTSPLQPVSVPILVGVTGKRKIRLDELGVAEALVRLKLRRAFALLQELAPNSPKILVCGMADGVDEIAARLVIEAVDERNPGQREFHNWSIVGLLPMPEEAFVDDFAPDAGWWYRKLPEEQQNLIRLMPLQTLAKPAPCAAGSSLTAEDLRRQQDGSNPARTAHYEQLGMVLAERSTVLIAVMPEDETPDRLGGTAQVVAHRLNGWRQGWPPASSRDIAARSSEIVVPPPLATPVADGVWLVPVGGPAGAQNPIDLRILRQRKEFEPAWPDPILSRHSARRTIPLLWWRADRDVLIRRGHRRLKAAWSCCPLLRSLDAFNRRAAGTTPRPPPGWDHTIVAHPDEPARWSPLAATERLRGTLSDIQRDRKSRVGQTVTRLAIIAIVSIALLELYAELFETERGELLQAVPFIYIALIVGALLQAVPFIYVALIVAAMLLYAHAVRRSWPAVAEDYRLVAEALRVQIVWWRIGLTTRRDRVDNFILRYDTGAFQLLRRGLATLLDGLRFSHDEIPAALTDRLLDPALEWIREQIQYHEKTEKDRKRRYGRDEFRAWSLFGISLGAAVWLAGYTAVRLAAHTFVDVLGYVHDAKYWFSHDPHAWLIPLIAAAGGAVLLLALRIADIRSPERAFRAMHIIGSWLAGIFLGAAIVALWAIFDWGPDGLRKLLFLASVILLAWGGIIRYRTEKIAIEAEAQGSEMAYPIYRRAEAALEEVEHAADPEAARQRREQIIRDLGQFASAETEAWLRSHRERPLHPALG